MSLGKNIKLYEMKHEKSMWVFLYYINIPLKKNELWTGNCCGNFPSFTFFRFQNIVLNCHEKLSIFVRLQTTAASESDQLKTY